MACRLSSPGTLVERLWPTAERNRIIGRIDRQPTQEADAMLDHVRHQDGY